MVAIAPVGCSDNWIRPALQIAYNLRLKRMVILDVGAIATDENLAGKIQKLTNSANTVLIVVNPGLSISQRIN
ncbi:hypothetical protein [Nostoc sp.]|uniref:hypothetical protein n=1 Tax=Nostoc sp. TaxID=1180 RepID=UPI002FF47BBD